MSGPFLSVALPSQSSPAFSLPPSPSPPFPPVFPPADPAAAGVEKAAFGV